MMIARKQSHLGSSMAKENNKVKGVKDDWRINKSVAVKLSKESHVCYASLLHTILIQLQPCSYSFQDLVTSKEKKSHFILKEKQ
jgi:hypothetical protein